MKKILGLLILIFLMNQSSYAKSKIGSPAKEVCKTLYFCYSNLISSIYYPKFKTEIWYAKKEQDYFYVFKNVEKASQFHLFNLKHKFYGTSSGKKGGELVGVFYKSLQDAQFVANPDILSEWKNKQENKKDEKKIAEKPKKQEPRNSFKVHDIIKEFNNAPTKDSKGRVVYYFFSYTPKLNIFYGWATLKDGLSPSYHGEANFINYNSGKNFKNCKIKSTQTKNNAPFEGLFEMDCPSDSNQNVFGTWSQEKISKPGIGYGFNKNGEQVSAFFSNQKAVIINSLNLFNPNSIIADNQPKKQQPKSTPDDSKVVAAASGTGFFVSSVGHIISNHHVIEGCDETTLSFKGREIKADILAIDKKNDLAILKADLTPSKVYSVATEDASLLEDIIIAGYPLGKKVSAAIKTSKGSITALAGYGDNYSEFQTDAALNQGNSGGPIMNQKGNVIGVAVANYGKKAGVESFNFGIKSSTLRTFANSNGLKFLPPNSREMSNKDLGTLITDGTVYLECYMTVAKIKRMIAEAENRKAFFSEYQ